MKRQRCKICKRGYGYFGALGCIHVFQDVPWSETEKILEECKWESESEKQVITLQNEKDRQDKT